MLVLAVDHLIKVKSMAREFEFNQFGPGLQTSKMDICILCTETNHDKLKLNDCIRGKQCD